MTVKGSRSGPGLAESPDVLNPRLCRLALSGVVFLALALAGSRCSAVFEKPELQFRGLRVNSIGLNGASIDIIVDVYNPNSYRLGVDRFSYDLAIENVHFGAGETDAPVSVEGRSRATVRLPLDLDWSRLGEVGRGALNTGSVNYGVSGEMSVTTGFGKFRVPYTKSGRFSVLSNSER
jgi:LEA14-like dessication related protein